MSWYAVEALEDAIEGTRELLFPLDASTWLRLAIIVFFLGGTSTASPIQSSMRFSSQSGDSLPVVPGNLSIPSESITTAVIVFIAVVVLLALFFTVVGSVMEFAFIESLRTRHVHVRQYAKSHLDQGLSLFAFRFVLFLVILLPVAGIALVTVPALSYGSANVPFGPLLFLLPVLFVLGILVALVDGLTRAFVVPVMVVRDGGVLDGWKAFWPTLRREWKQYGVYLVLRFFVGVAASFVVSIVGGVLSVLLLIPFAIIGVLLVAAFGGFSALGTILSNPVLVAVFVVLLVIYVLCVIFALALVQVPIRAYTGYFSLFVLGDTNEAFDLIPALREKIR